MKSDDLFQKPGGLMKKLALAIALILLPLAAEAKGGRKVFSAKADGVTAPELVAGPAITASGFPVQNHVDLRVVIDKDGRAMSYGPTDRWSDPELVAIAEKVVQERWRFKPATMTWRRGGTTTPVRVRTTVRVPAN